MLKSQLIMLFLTATAHAFQPLLPLSFTKTTATATGLYMATQDVDTKEDIRVGVIGMGRIGLVHLEAITKAPGVRPVIVSNPTVSKAEAGALSRATSLFNRMCVRFSFFSLFLFRVSIQLPSSSTSLALQMTPWK